ncbi:hypothetical protein MTR_6g024055 [Medicago truncatula]|uniref:Uncharacterized protein n=1 Tax=Medicago truncatula TaxID=3880 RepID=A0A072U733_MEDTR|nr:hypothetical protein MTR_6g024055 [Medicago truncatula]
MVLEVGTNGFCTKIIQACSSYAVAGLAADGRQLTMTGLLHLIATFTSADHYLLFLNVVARLAADGRQIVVRAKSAEATNHDSTGYGFQLSEMQMITNLPLREFASHFYWVSELGLPLFTSLSFQPCFFHQQRSNSRHR